jgi:hypothetical protein
MTPDFMVGMAMAVFLICMVAGGITVAYSIRSFNTDPRKWYIGAKGLVILYLGIMYGIVAVDYYYDIVVYPTVIHSTTGQLLRVAAVVTAFIFLMDTWIRDKR